MTFTSGKTYQLGSIISIFLLNIHAGLTKKILKKVMSFMKIFVVRFMCIIFSCISQS